MTLFARIAMAVALGIAASLPEAASAGCGPEPAPCEVAGGRYHAELPGDGPPRAALVFLHGWGSSGEGAMRLRGMVKSFNAAGYAVIAPDGMPRAGQGGGRWNFHPDFASDRDDIAFLRGVRDDAARRFGHDPASTVLAGFSIGGSMASRVACEDPGAFAAYAPLGGGMWRPQPTACAGPVRLIHVHGWRDRTVPLEGRAVRGASALAPGALVQGDVFESMQIWRAANGCVQFRADLMWQEDGFWHRAWDSCSPGSALELVLFDGGHLVPEGWSRLVLDWLNRAP